MPRQPRQRRASPPAITPEQAHLIDAFTEAVKGLMQASRKVVDHDDCNDDAGWERALEELREATAKVEEILK